MKKIAVMFLVVCTTIMTFGQQYNPPPVVYATLCEGTVVTTAGIEAGRLARFAMGGFTLRIAQQR